MEFAGVILGHFRYISRPPSGDFCKEPFENQLIGMNRLLIVLSAVLFSLTAVAQQDPQLTQFYQDRLSFNPAFAGAERLQYVSAFYRNQWNGLETNPQTTLVQYNGRPGFIPGGIGLSFFQDKLGQEENTVVKLAYAYHMEPDANGGILSLGLAANYMGKTLGNEWIYIDEGDAVTHIFTFTNTGDNPLIIDRCKGSCGCTVPKCPKEPIAPGEEGEIEVKFNSKGKKNKQTKTVTINANTVPEQTRITISANVTPAPAADGAGK